MKFHQLRAKVIISHHVLILLALLLLEGGALNHAVAQDASRRLDTSKKHQESGSSKDNEKQKFYELALEVSGLSDKQSGNRDYNSAPEAPHTNSSSSLSFDWCAFQYSVHLYACWAACRVDNTPDYCTSYCAYVVCRLVRACRSEELSVCERHNPDKKTAPFGRE